MPSVIAVAASKPSFIHLYKAAHDRLVPSVSGSQAEERAGGNPCAMPAEDKVNGIENAPVPPAGMV
jgi:hypothetical protein